MRLAGAIPIASLAGLALELHHLSTMAWERQPQACSSFVAGTMEHPKTREPPALPELAGRQASCLWLVVGQGPFAWLLEERALRRRGRVQEQAFVQLARADVREWPAHLVDVSMLAGTSAVVSLQAVAIHCWAARLIRPTRLSSCTRHRTRYSHLCGK